MSTSATGLLAQPERGTDLDIPAGEWSVQSFGMTDPGLVRPSNEDNFLIARLTKALRIQQTSLPQSRLQYSEEQGYLFVVADGMGGHQAGEQASALAVDAIESFVLNTLKWFMHLKGAEGQTLLNEFHAALQQADARIFREASRHSEWWGMGTTLTMAYTLHRDLFVGHVGDSRCYLCRGGELYQLTHDHTLVQEMVEHGHLPAEEAGHHRLRHVITNVLGSTEPGVRPEVHKVHLEAGDVMLLCSDGLTEMVDDETIVGELRADPDVRHACERLVALAKEKGGRDNITVVLARFDWTPREAA
jgi:protein phosphatase